MATRIRLKRIGRRNRPFYRVVVIDSHKRRDGAALEELGWYNPIDPGNSYQLNEERVFHWLAQGAQASDTVSNLLRKSGIAFKWHLKSRGLDEKAVEKELQKWQLKQAEKAQRTAPKPQEPPQEVPPSEEPVTETATEAEIPEEQPTGEATIETTPVTESEVSVDQSPAATEASVGDLQTDTDDQNSSAIEETEDKQQTGEG